MSDPIEGRIRRWMGALAAARAAAVAFIGPGKPYSQNSIANRLKRYGEDGTQQRTIGRFINDDKTSPRVDTLFRIFAAVPEVADAFENALAGAQGDAADRASWDRIGRRMSSLMTTDDAYRLIDALEDLAALGNLDTTWPHLRRAAIDARRALAREEEAPADHGRKKLPA